MNADTLVMKAAGFAKKAHVGQKYGEGDYYQNHLVQVAHIYTKKFGYDSVGVAVCYPHDVIEDTDTDMCELEKVFGLNVAEAVGILTHLSGESYKGYLRCITENKLWSRVKWADSYVNLQKCIETEQWSRGQKYLKNLDYLTAWVG